MLVERSLVSCETSLISRENGPMLDDTGLVLHETGPVLQVLSDTSASERALRRLITASTKLVDRIRAIRTVDDVPRAGKRS
jgi:hypothetical protein